MKRTELDAIYTAKVATYLAEGYTFSTNTMGGSQGEIAHVDLRKGDDVLRIWMDSQYSVNFWCRTVHIFVGRSHRAVRPEVPNWTIWNNELEIIDEEIFAEVTRDWYTSTGEGQTIEELREARRSAQRVVNKHPLTPTTEFIRSLKKRKGFSAATAKNITVERTDYGYSVHLAARDGRIARTENVFFKTKR